MTETVNVKLYKPSDWTGKLICWRLWSNYSHATIEIDGIIYSATFPKVVSVNTETEQNTKNYEDFAMPPRKGNSFEINVTPEQKEKIKAYCVSKLGTNYNILSAIGWALHTNITNNNQVYCFDYVYRAFLSANIFSDDISFITGDQLLEELYKKQLITELPKNYTLKFKH